ncbi:MAG: bifunctional phosphopantothenoylcysteine decarboxylase/phosphopantothenate--cysteine ligase CoaBC [Pseudomonadota bacterium]
MPTSRFFKDRTICLGVCGSIAAHRALDVASALVAEGAEVHVLMTAAARRFVAPLPFEAITGQPVTTDLFETREAVPHIELAAKAELLCIAPATATTIARLASGTAEDPLCAVYLATKGRVLLCPAMNTNMWEHRQVQENLSRLRSAGVHVLPPAVGRLACGVVGTGRLAPVAEIVENMRSLLSPKDLLGVKALITSGPTREPLDDVRFLTNPSTGRMGHALAQVGARRGARVTLITGPVSLPDPRGVEVVRVKTAEEMQKAVEALFPGSDVLVMAAAVSDFRPAAPAPGKLPKEDLPRAVQMELCPDILAGAAASKAPRQVVVGFAAEAQDPVEHGFEKLRRKKLDLIVVNDITAEGAGFGVETNLVRIIDPKGNSEELPLMHKELVSERIWDRILTLLLRGGERR